MTVDTTPDGELRAELMRARAEFSRVVVDLGAARAELSRARRERLGELDSRGAIWIDIQRARAELAAARAELVRLNRALSGRRAP